jgi:DNA phosphorothioation-dependent restriction protein DptG
MKEFISIDGKEYRVVANWNAIRDYCYRKRVKNLQEIGNVLCFGLDGVLTMAHCCIKEGERLEGRELEFDEVGLGAIMMPVDMTRFLEIYTRQTTANLPVKEDSKKK